MLGIEIGMKESLEKLKEIIGRLRLKEGIFALDRISGFSLPMSCPTTFSNV